MRALVVVPTYNEAESVVEVLDRVLAADPRVDVLVVDDGSPDGTAKLVLDRADGEPRVHLMERSGKQGLGAAYRAGFGWGLERGYDALVEMDADLSHPPDRLPALLDGLATADLVIGSRYVPGGRTVNWSRLREAISRGGNTYVRLALGMPLKDATGVGSTRIPAASRKRRTRSDGWAPTLSQCEMRSASSFTRSGESFASRGL